MKVADAIAHGFSTEAGKTALNVLREIFYDQPITAKDNQSLSMAFKLGQRDVIMFIHDCITEQGKGAE